MVSRSLDPQVVAWACVWSSWACTGGMEGWVSGVEQAGLDWSILEGFIIIVCVVNTARRPMEDDSVR